MCLSFKVFETGNHLPLNDFMNLLNDVTQILKTEEAIINHLELSEQRYVVVGDIHGNFWDLWKVFEDNRWPGNDKVTYIFAGDYVRGDW